MKKLDIKLKEKHVMVESALSETQAFDVFLNLQCSRQNPDLNHPVFSELLSISAIDWGVNPSLPTHIVGFSSFRTCLTRRFILVVILIFNIWFPYFLS